MTDPYNTPYTHLMSDSVTVSGLTAERDEARAEREVLRTLLIRARDMLDWVGGSCEGIDKTVQMVEAFQAEIDAQIEKECSDE